MNSSIRQFLVTTFFRQQRSCPLIAGNTPRSPQTFPSSFSMGSQDAFSQTPSRPTHRTTHPSSPSPSPPALGNFSATNRIQGQQVAARKRCVRMQLQANAAQKGGVATHLAPKGLLPFTAALRGSAGRRSSQKEAGTTRRAALEPGRFGAKN